MAANDPKTVDLLMARLNEANLGLAKFTKAMGEMNVALLPVGVELKKLAVSFGQWAVQTAVVQKAMTGISNAAFAVTAKLEPLALKLAQAYVSIETAIAPALQKIGGVVSDFVAKMETAAYHVVKQFEPLANVAAKVYVTLEPLGKAVAGAMGPLLSASAAAAKGLASVATAAGRSVFTAGTAAAGAGVAAGGAAMSGVVASAQALVNAFKGPIDGFQRLAGSMRGFVEAVNPSAILQFDMAMRNLIAGIGQAVQPLFNVMTGLVNEMNSVLTPVLASLRPVIDSLGQSMMNFGGVFIQSLGSVVTSLKPVFEAVTGTIAAIMPVYEAMYSALAGFAEVVGSITKSIFGDFNVFDTLKSAMRELSAVFLESTAVLLKWIDSLLGTTMGNDFIKGATRGLTGEGQEKKSAVAVAKDARIGGIADFASNVSKNALLAGPGGQVQSKDQQEEAWRKETAENLKKIAAGEGSPAMKRIEQKIDESITKLAARVEDAILELKGKVWEGGKDVAKGALNIATGGLSGMLFGK